MVQASGLFGVIVVMSTLGCQFHDRHAEELVVDQVPETLAIVVGSGDVRVIGSDIAEVRVSAWIDGPSNHVEQGVVDGRVTVFGECNEEPCNVDLTVTTPRSTALELRTGSGDLELEGLRSPIALATGSGNVSGFDLRGLDFTAQTGSGDLQFDFSRGAERVELRTGSGDVALTVPSGSYRLNLSAGAGDQEIRGISDDPGASRTIAVHTGSGDLRLIGR